MNDLAEADSLAYQLIRRIDAGDHGLDVERAAALRERTYELRTRFLRYPALSWTVLASGLPAIGVGALLGLAANVIRPGDRGGQLLLVAPVSLLFAIAVVAGVALRRRWRRRAVPPDVPGPVAPAPGGLREHADALARAVLSVTGAAKQRHATAAAHLNAAVARVWSLAHGGPVVDRSIVDGSPDRWLARWLARIAANAHWAVHRAHSEPDPFLLLGTVARFEEARLLLSVLRERRARRLPGWLTPIAMVLMMAAGAVLGSVQYGDDWIVAAVPIAVGIGIGLWLLLSGLCSGRQSHGWTAIAEAREAVHAGLSAAMAGTWQEDPAQDTLRRAQELLADA